MSFEVVPCIPRVDLEINSNISVHRHGMTRFQQASLVSNVDIGYQHRVRRQRLELDAVV